MTAAQYPTTRPAPRTAPKGETTPPVLRMVRAIYQGQAGGWFELQVIAGDPSDTRNKAHTPAGYDRWHCWQPNDPAWLATFVQTVEQLAAHYGNVYVSRTCYAVPQRSAAVALPSSALFIDDAPDGQYTFTLQTSANSQQGWLLTAEPMDATTYRELASRAAQDADKSGADVVQLVRLPSTFNTKRCTNRAQWWPVTIHPAVNRTYRLDELRHRWPAVATAHGQPTTIDAEQVEYYLTNVKLLLNKWGYPKRLKLNSPGVKVLKRRARVDDRSAARYSVAKSLYVHGYPDAEIAALLLHFCDYGQSKEKGSDWLDTDIARIIGKLHDAYQDSTQSPTRLDGDVQPTQPRTRCKPERRPAHRPRTKSADELLDFYQHNTSGRDAQHRPAVIMRRKDVAAEFKVSLATLRRLELQLFGRGDAERITPAARTSSYVVLLKDAEKGTIKSTEMTPIAGTIKSTANEPPAPPEYRTPITQTANSAHAAIGGHTPNECTAPAPAPAPVPVPVSGVCPPPDAAASAIPSRAELVREALAVFGAFFFRRRKATRVQVVTEYITSKYGVVLEPARVECLLAAEQRRQAVAAVQALEPWQLKQQQRCYEGRVARAMHAGKEKQANLWVACLRGLDAEFKRRGLDPTVNYRKPRKVRANAPTLQPLPLLEMNARPTLAEQPVMGSVLVAAAPSVNQDVLHWRASLVAGLAAQEIDDPDMRLEREAMSFANSFMWESARDRIARMQDREWARQLTAIVADMLYRTGL